MPDSNKITDSVKVSDPRRTLIAFDLDDTLFKERDFEASGFRAAAFYVAGMSVAHAEHFVPMLEFAAMNRAEMHPFDAYIAYLHHVGLSAPTVDELKEAYRMHEPDIELDPSIALLLDDLTGKGYKLGIITDGRVITQLNKVRALGLMRWIEPADIIVSQAIGADKSTDVPYRTLAERHPECDCFVYVGDNPAKDFRYPNLMGWTTVQLDDTEHINVHSQDTDGLANDYHAQIHISKLGDLKDYLD